MKLYSENTGKFTLVLGVGLLMVVLLVSLLCGGVANLGRQAFAEQASDDTIENSLDEFTEPTTLKQESGTSTYLIESVDDLRSLAYYVNIGKDTYATYASASYKLTCDLNLSNMKFWEAIGTKERPFMGVFDGGGNSIYGLTIIENKTASEVEGKESSLFTYRGLFGYVKYYSDENTTRPAEIKYLGLKDTLIRSHGRFTGSLVAYAEGKSTTEVGMVKITECYNTGYVEGGWFVGGLVGSMVSCAVMNDCYFAGTARDLARFGTGIVNKTLDVATNEDGGSVGGLAGSATDNGDTPVIKNCYNAGIVGSTDASYEISRGALVGSKNGFTIEIHSECNFFLSSVLTKANSVELRNQGGEPCALSNIKKRFLSDLGFNVDCAGSSDSDYLPTLADGATWQTWQWSDKVNNGLPFLHNAQQLVRIEFVTKDANGDVIENGAIANTITNSDIVCLTTTDNKYFVRIQDGATLNFASNVTAKSDSDYTYKFSAWDKVAFATSINTGTGTNSSIKIIADDTSPEQAVSYAEKDKIFVAKYVEREYTISLKSNGDSYATAVGLQIFVGEATPTFVAKVKFNTQNVTVSATPNAGYYLRDFAANVGETNYVSQGNGAWTLDVQGYIRALGQQSKESTADTIMATEITVIANFEPAKYYVYKQTNIPSCTYASIVANAVTPLSNGSSVGYNEPIYLKIDPRGIAQNYVFDKWVYQAVDAGYQPSEDVDKWIGIENSIGGNDEITFIIPNNLTDGQSLYFKAMFKKVSYTLTIINNNTAAGNISLQNADDNVFDFDEYAKVAIEKYYGYDFDSVIINGQSYRVGETGQLEYANASWDAEKSCLSLKLAANTTIEVNFTRLEYDVIICLGTINYISSETRVWDEKGQNALYQVHKVLYEGTLKFTVALENGYEIASVKANGEDKNISQDDKYYIATITGDTEIVITLSKKSFDVNVSITYAETYDYSVDDSCIHGAGKYYYGDKVTIKIDLPEMFEIECWRIGETEIETSTEAILTRQNVDKDYNIQVVLSLKKSTISFTQIGSKPDTKGYTIYTKDKSAGETYSEGLRKIVNYGDSVRLKVDDLYINNTNNAKYVFAYWQINKEISTASEYELIANQVNILVTAVYQPAQVAVLVGCYEFDNLTEQLKSSDEAGTVTGFNASTAAYGSQITLTAKARDGYKFYQWVDKDGKPLKGIGSQDEIYTFTVDHATDVRAVFVKIRSVNVICDENEGVVTGAQKWIVGETAMVSATAKKGYKFVSWNENGNSVATTDNYTFKMLDADKTLTAVFERIYAIACSTNDNSMGQVVGNTSGSFRENVTLEAISANNCSFVGWMINNVLISNSTTLNISLNGDIEVQALFKKNFDWNIIIVILGSAIFALVMVYGAIAYIKSREAQPVNTRPLIGSKDDSDIIRKSSKRNALRDEITPVPTRKVQRVNVQPIPVRKIAVEPTDHKGNKVKPSAKAKDKKSTLKTEE